MYWCYACFTLYAVSIIGGGVCLSCKNAKISRKQTNNSKQSCLEWNSATRSVIRPTQTISWITTLNCETKPKTTMKP